MSFHNTVRIWATDTGPTTDALPATVLTAPNHLSPHLDNFDWSSPEAHWDAHPPSA
ncbi:hypothetical protein ACFV0H_38355 [Streptomyces erythrochromogenes]|uniref:Uncharacterized protein n=1 Tax=Streptomyces erythrochromogenes TaxID=285574 RepID=A0ABZ1Q4F2_9ACTN|nr:hypothetical protein [Streptomyces erythrochromogenes]MCX5584047.1 hypothetical protein [Streptomyces erythrochromogenes]